MNDDDRTERDAATAARFLKRLLADGVANTDAVQMASAYMASRLSIDAYRATTDLNSVKKPGLRS